MADGSEEEKTVTKLEMWRERIAEHDRSGSSIKEFCKERGLTAWSFYSWRKRLREAGPVRFALLETKEYAEMPASLELVLATGERLRIGNQVNEATLRLVLDAVRG